MRDLGRRLMVGLAVAVAAVAAVGYGLIATNIADPLDGNLGTIPVPDRAGATAGYLADGRPVFVVRTTDDVHVIDARAPREQGEPGVLVTWCPGHEQFFDWLHGGWYRPDGGLLGSAPSGLVSYPFTISEDGVATVASDGAPAAAEPDPSATGGCESDSAVMHRPDPGDVFDPSVAVDVEPPGWIWLEGRLEVAGEQVLLCDDVEAAGCATGAVVSGIDPARLAALSASLSGRFLGRIGDGVVDVLHHAPLSVSGP